MVYLVEELRYVHLLPKHTSYSSAELALSLLFRSLAGDNHRNSYESVGLSALPCSLLLHIVLSCPAPLVSLTSASFRPSLVFLPSVPLMGDSCRRKACSRLHKGCR